VCLDHNRRLIWRRFIFGFGRERSKLGEDGARQAFVAHLPGMPFFKLLRAGGGAPLLFPRAALPTIFSDLSLNLFVAYALQCVGDPRKSLSEGL